MNYESVTKVGVESQWFTVRSFGLNPSLTPLLGLGLAVCPEPDRVFCFGSALVQQNGRSLPELQKSGGKERSL